MMLILDEPKDNYTRSIKEIAALIGLTEWGVRKAILATGKVRGIRIAYQRNEGRCAPIRVSDHSFTRLVERVSAR